ncbi:MAG TPA: dihydroorotate dehydrogenase electron transfer subunit [Abditibacteriaceae bacterium]|jgi:dihydroorotate dehydrogenase electron transfer subunit
MQRIVAPIIHHAEVAPRHFRMTVEAPAVATTARAGHFVHVLPRADSSFDPLLRRAFSILSVGASSFDFLYRVDGRGTEQLSRLTPNDTVDLLGPLGKPFEPVENSAILVGGGVGLPPMAMLARQERGAGHEAAQISVILGARSSTELVCLEDFAGLGITPAITTDDGSAGHHGRVTDLLESQLSDRCGDTAGLHVYACGPLPMLRAVSAVCQRHGVRCQVSLEENMPCGVGVCNGCVVPVNGGGDDFGRYRRICVDGPVIWSVEIDWNSF